MVRSREKILPYSASVDASSSQPLTMRIAVGPLAFLGGCDSERGQHDEHRVAHDEDVELQSMILEIGIGNGAALCGETRSHPSPD